MDSSDEQQPVRSKIADQLVHYARMGDVNRMRQILRRDTIDVNHPSSLGLRPLSVAARHGHEKVARLLLEKGADARAHDTFGGRGAAPLHWATTNNHKRIVTLLLDAGADVSAIDFNGATPLHDAARRGNTGVVSMLLAAGANPLARDFEGQTPRDMAATDATRTILRRSGILSGTRPSSVLLRRNSSRENRPGSRSVSPRRRSGSPARSPERPQSSCARVSRYSSQFYENVNRHQSVQPQGKTHLSRTQRSKKLETQNPSSLSPFEQIITHYHNRRANSRLMNDPYTSIESESYNSENGFPQIGLVGQPLTGNLSPQVSYNLPGEAGISSQETHNSPQNAAQNIAFSNHLDIAANNANMLHFSSVGIAPVTPSVEVDRCPSRCPSPSPTHRTSQADPESLSKFCDEFIHQSILMSPSRSISLTPSQYNTQLRTHSPTRLSRQSSPQPTLRTANLPTRSALNRARSQSPRIVTPTKVQRNYPSQTHTIYNYQQVSPFQKTFKNEATPSNVHTTSQSNENENRNPSPQRDDFMNKAILSPIESCSQSQSQQCSPAEQSDPCPFIVSCTQPCNQINFQPPISAHIQLSDVNSSPLAPLPSNIQASQFVSQIQMQPIAPIPIQPLTQPPTQSILQTFTQPVIQGPTDHINQNLTPHCNKISMPPTNQTITQPLNQGFIQFPNQSSKVVTNPSSMQPINQATTLTVSQPSQNLNQSVNQQGNQNTQAVTDHSIQPTYQPTHTNQSVTHSLNYPLNASPNLPYNQSTYFSNTQPIAHLSIQPISQPFRAPIIQTPLHPTASFTLSIGHIPPLPEASPQPNIQTFAQISTPTNQTAPQIINPTFDQKSSQPANQPSSPIISKARNTKSQQQFDETYAKTLIEAATSPFNQQYSQYKIESSQRQLYPQYLGQSLKQTSQIISAQPTSQPSQQPSQQHSQQPSEQPSAQPSPQSSFHSPPQTPIELTQHIRKLTDISAQPDSESCEPQSHSSTQLSRQSTQHLKDQTPQSVNQTSRDHHNQPPTQALGKSSTYPLYMSPTQPVKQVPVQPSTLTFTYSNSPSLSQSSSHPLIHSSTQTLSLPVYQEKTSPSPSLIPIHAPTHSFSETPSPAPSKHSPKLSPSQNLSPHSLPPSPPPSDRSSQGFSLSSSPPFSPSPSPIHSHTSFPSRSRTSPHLSPVQSRSLSYNRQFHPRIFLSKPNSVRSQNLFLTQQPSRHSKQNNVEITVEQKLPNYNQQSTKIRTQQTTEETKGQLDEKVSQQHTHSQEPPKDIIEDPNAYCKRHSQKTPNDQPSDKNLIQINPDLIYEHIHKVAQEQKEPEDDPTEFFVHHKNIHNENDNSLTVSQTEESDVTQQEQDVEKQLDQVEQIVIHTTSHHAACPRRLANCGGMHGAHKCGINVVRSTAFCPPETSQHSQHSHRSHSSTLCAANKAENERLLQEANYRHAQNTLYYQDVDSSSPHPVHARYSQSQSNNRYRAGVNVYLIPSKSHTKACPHVQYNEQSIVTELVEVANTGREEAVISLLSNGMKIDKPDPKMRISALHLASRNGHVTAVTTLIRCGANIESQDEGGVTALHWASSNGHARVVHTLLKAGAKVDPISKQGRSPLHEAAAGGHAMVVNLLLQAGADPNLKDKMMLSPLDIATGMIHSTLIQHSL